MALQYYNVICRNVKCGTNAKSGNRYYSYGLLIQDGPRKGEWMNYYKTKTENTISHIKKDEATMGIVFTGRRTVDSEDSPEDFTLDLKECVAAWGQGKDPNYTQEKVTGVYPKDGKSPRVTNKDLNNPPPTGDLPF